MIHPHYTVHSQLISPRPATVFRNGLVAPLNKIIIEKNVFRMDNNGVYVKNTAEETAVSNDILKLPSGLLEKDR